MENIYYFAAGLVVGAVLMFFIYANNNKRFQKVADEVKDKVKDIENRLNTPPPSGGQ